MSSLSVLSIASEIYPLIKTGGLADVAGALPEALARENVAIRTLIPGYPAVMAKLESPTPVHVYSSLMGAPARVLAARAGGLDLFVLDAPQFFGRPGNPYLDVGGRDWPDNDLRFAALARAGADLGKGAVANYAADVVHAHDWQGALAPVFLHYDGGRRPRTVLTIHNIAFQGHFPAATLGAIGLPAHAMQIDGVEYFNGVGYLKGGLMFADRITTVSPTYAREIMTPEFGMALDGLLRVRADAVEGIVNGIDDSVWNPATDSEIAVNYSALRIEMRAGNKAALQRRFGLTVSSDPALVGVISRLTAQKGLDLLLAELPDLVAHGAQLALLGSGDKSLEEGFLAAAQNHPGAIACMIGYDENLSHLMQAGIDFIVVPSRFEPCGLTQLYGLRYGATPIVARVGGLADTVIDANDAALSAGVATGLQFSPPSAPSLAHALKRAFALYADEAAMRRTRLNGMRADVSWRGPAKQYAALYRTLARTDA
ncbi:MAG: glycogen synthase GlgA [Bradyrhizobium sp.]|nr:MAG: glycogen synthase GlgA [Bradyrhizobium sp.]